MTTEEMILDKLRALPPEKKQEALDFVEFLDQKCRGKRPYPSLHGLCADLGVDISEEDIAEARRDMWGNFPREFPDEDEAEEPEVARSSGAHQRRSRLPQPEGQGESE
jgi:hypothetical protein